MKWFLTHKKALFIAITFMLIGQPALAATAYVPARISIKFILSSGGTRPATGNLNTDAEINTEFDWGNTILAENMSELRLELLELVDLAGVSQYYSSTADSTNRDNLRSDAMSNPTTYGWRTDAINIYINGGTGSAISKFPPDNDIILMNQWCGNNPSCLLHELGHSLHLLHTHETCCTNQDYCADTIEDDSGWSRNQIAQNAFGKNYADCTPSEKDQVDLVFNNVMSYHTSEPQLRLSACQMNRTSSTADSDRAWLLTREPVYVNSSYTGSETGRFATPYKTLQAAINAGLTNKVVVLQQAGYTAPTSAMDVPSYMVTRSGISTVGQGCLLYSLPVDLEKSKTPGVSNAIKAVQSEDKAARKAMKDAKETVKMVGTKQSEQEKSSIIEFAKAKRKQHKDNAIGHLLNAETFAGGKEKTAIQLELAQRYKHSENFAEAIGFFLLVADNTTQPHLRVRALYEANYCNELIEKAREDAVSEQNSVQEEQLTEEEEPAKE